MNIPYIPCEKVVRLYYYDRPGVSSLMCKLLEDDPVGVAVINVTTGQDEWFPHSSIQRIVVPR